MQHTTIVSKIKFAKSVIYNAIEKHGDKVAISCSFGKDSIVVVHLALQIKKNIPIITVVTKFWPEETYKYKKDITACWNLNLKEYRSNIKVKSNLYKINPNKCCEALKIEPMKRAVKNYDGLITGLRSTEGLTRKHIKSIEKQGLLIKYNPIINWTELDVWKYIAINHIPIHPWYNLGYRSLDCAPCSSIVSDEQGERTGRWAGTSKCGGECGIHTEILKDK